MTGSNRFLKWQAPVAGASAVFAALAFGVGYLAAKQHDQTLGIISTTSYSHYVRTGVEFIPRSLSAIGIYVSMTMRYVVLIAVVALIFVGVAWWRSGVDAAEAQMKTAGTQPKTADDRPSGKRLRRMSWRLPVLVGLCAATAFLEILYFP